METNAANLNISNALSTLLVRVKETESENEMLKQEVKKLLLDKEKEKLIVHNTETGIKQLLNQFEYQVDNLTSSFESSFTGSVVSSIIDVLWRIFNYETCSSDIKETNHRLREKLNKKLLNSTIMSSETTDYACSDSLNEKNACNKNCSIDLSFLAQQTAVLKQKVASQTSLIKSLIESVNKRQSIEAKDLNQSESFVVSSLSLEDHPTTSEFTSTATTNPDDDLDESDSYIRNLDKTNSNHQYFVCPKCEIQIDKKQITISKYKQHVYKCEPSKLVCIFCLEIFDFKQEIEFNQHIQRHLKKTNTVDRDLSSEFNNSCQNFASSASVSVSTASSSNPVSSFSSRSNSHSNISDHKPNNLVLSSPSQQQQQQRAHKNCLLIQNFEPKIRKRL